MKNITTSKRQYEFKTDYVMSEKHFKILGSGCFCIFTSESTHFLALPFTYLCIFLIMLM